MSNKNDKALHILTQIATYTGSISIKELSADLKMPLSSVYRYIALLKEWNLVEEEPYSKKVYIGSTSLLLSQNYQRNCDIDAEIDSVLKRLTDATGETTAFMVPSGYHAMCIATHESNEALRCSFEIGQTQPLCRGASSKVILTYMSEEWQKKIADFYGFDITGNTWRDGLKKIREERYAVSSSEINNGVIGISAPVIRRNQLVGALTIMAPGERAHSLQQRLIDSVKEAAISLSKENG